MSKIFELYGYRLDMWDDVAQQNMLRGWCPFMGDECDGGGNRYQSAIDIKSNPVLRKMIPNKDKVQCGVCSLQIHSGEQPWIVCPRRLLTAKGGIFTDQQSMVRNQLSEYSDLHKQGKYLIWSEVKIKTDVVTDEDEEKFFDYTFDYIIAAVAPVSLRDAVAIMGMPSAEIKKIAQKGNYTLTSRAGDVWIEDFPLDPIIIIEVMTSSTSGGNKTKRTQIGMACEDAMLHGMKHEAPGINYRQVWARMVSQLIVKSQVGMSWGGKTVWLVQDLLADYISQTTALHLPEYISDELNEVNILAFGYGDAIEKKDKNLISLKQSNLFAGPIQKNDKMHKLDGFVDIIKIGAPPPKEQIWKSLIGKSPLGIWKWN